MAFIIRPVEAVTHLMPLSCVFWTIAFFKGRISLKEIYVMTLGASIGACILIACGWLTKGVASHSPIYENSGEAHFYNIIGTIVFVSAGILLLLPILASAYKYICVKSSLSSHIVNTYILIYACVVLFYFRLVPKLTEWIYTCSYGSLGQLVERPPLPYTAWHIVQDSGFLPFLVLTALGILSTVLLLVRKEAGRLPHMEGMAYLLSTIPLVLALALFSTQFDQRKVTVIVDIYLVVLMVPILLQGNFWLLRNTAVALLALLQIWVAFGIAQSGSHRFASLFYGTVDAYPALIRTSPNPNTVIVNFLEAFANSHHIRKIRMPIPPTLIIDHFLMKMMLSIRGNGLSATFHYIPVYTQHTVTDFLQNDRDDFLLINAIPGSIQKAPEDLREIDKLDASTHDANEHLRFGLQKFYIEGKLDDMHITKKACVYIASYAREACIFGKAP